MRWVPPCNRALAEPRPDDAEGLDRARRTLALYDRVLHALDAAGAPIAAGTDVSNPLVVPRFPPTEAPFIYAIDRAFRVVARTGAPGRAILWPSTQRHRARS